MKKKPRKLPRAEIVAPKPTMDDLRRELELATYRAEQAEARSKHLESILPGIVNKLQVDNVMSMFAAKVEGFNEQVEKLLTAIDPDEEDSYGLLPLLRQEQWERRDKLGVAPVADICEALRERSAEALETIASFCFELAGQKRSRK